MKGRLSAVLLLTVCVWAHGQERGTAAGPVTESWTPTTNQIEAALVVVEDYCRTELSDDVRMKKAGVPADELQIEIAWTNSAGVVIVSGGAIDTNALPKDFKIYKIPYSLLKRSTRAFVEKAEERSVRIIAVQHLVPAEIVRRKKDAHLVTIYVNSDTGKAMHPARWPRRSPLEMPAIYCPDPPPWTSIECR